MEYTSPHQAYEDIFNRLDNFLDNDNIEFEIQCCSAILYMLLYEHIKFMCITQLQMFFDDDLHNIGEPKKTKKYIEECNKAGNPFEFAFNFFELEEREKEVLRNAQRRRAKASHEFLDILLMKNTFSLAELKEFYLIAKRIDNYWVVNIEIAIAGLENKEEANVSEARTLYFDMIVKIAKRIFLLMSPNTE